jgi:flavin-dependent dehydrogenase
MNAVDVCVIGGGPAGSASAIRLAQLGHRVVLVERAPRGRAHVGESLPPSILPLLDALGVREHVEAAGFLRPRDTLVQWAGALRDTRTHASHAAEPGFQVDRGRFDALLLDAAAAAGVTLIQPVAADAPQRDGPRMRVPLRDGREIHTQWVVDARGRRATAGPAPRTAALYAYWPAAGGDDARTRVESGLDAWYWGAPLPDGSFNATVFIDAARCAGLDRGARHALYRALLARSALLRPVLGGAVPADVRVCDATAGLAPDPAADGVLRVGEAAFTIDPLSSQGVQAALRGGLQAAVSLHTLLVRPGAADIALSFHADQVMRTAQHHARLAASFHAAAARQLGSAFWLARAGAAAPWRAPESPPAPAGLDANVMIDPRVSWEREPILDGEWIVEADAIDHPSFEAPAAFIGGVPVRELMRPLASSMTLRELLRRWALAYGDARAGALFSMLWRQGLIAQHTSQHGIRHD